MNSSIQFLYSLDNLSLFSTSITMSIFVILLGIVLMVVFGLFLHYVSGIFLVFQDRKVIEEKKQVLSDLILMKEIQTELEKEIEQAALKATFQNG